VLITHNAADVAPAWREQLREGARLVVPLGMGGYTRSLTLVRRGDVLHCEHWTYCGFVRDRGAAARTAPVLPLADGEVTVRWEDGEPVFDRSDGSHLGTLLRSWSVCGAGGS
jgi:protein-L-isoaspartate(D-aspartate) O-methyltransferase